MKETERQIFNTLCLEYFKSMMIRNEAMHNDEELFEKINNRLSEIEDKMLKYLKED